MNELTSAQRDRVMADLRMVIADAEELLRLGAEQAGSVSADWQAKFQSRLADAKEKMLDIQDTVVERAKAASQAADDYVHDNPWRSIGMAAGFGLLVGVLIGRR